ncbi:28S ribosomal protein S17, mitochondrial [Echinococcus granulosus]|uniref:28S ribosomal protein S17 n=1 Tax=Echinococcus granulosus TaxID=6210 RepID=U6JP82_ECHGR|nr:28S ribosomal protein S17 [Echinococcus granulosus]EUB58291.1 28S ribosomal protein S17 [Echinococcus granulosus]KAH9278385.1 28S ribosomal protein S17, mitochondrial [Echinococcus granulosus]CDS23660.1 28S ribosomal protein S17 mitochondrial [Echinococcus granulosus]
MVRYWMHRSARVQKLVEPHVQKLFPFHRPELEGVSPVNASYTGRVVKAPFDLALGKVVPFGQELTAARKDIIKVKIHKLCLNKFLLKYFYQTRTYWTHKQGAEADIGDIVLVERCDPPIAFNTVYKLKKVVFPVGNIVDPISGLRCEGPDYPLEVMQQWLDEHRQKS